MKLIKINSNYKDKDGQEHVGFHLALLINENQYVQIRPSFKEDYRLLTLLAENYEKLEK